jgi:hypothetical protein
VLLIGSVLVLTVVVLGDMSILAADQVLIAGYAQALLCVMSALMLFTITIEEHNQLYWPKLIKQDTPTIRILRHAERELERADRHVRVVLAAFEAAAVRRPSEHPHVPANRRSLQQQIDKVDVLVAQLQTYAAEAKVTLDSLKRQMPIQSQSTNDEGQSAARLGVGGNNQERKSN